MFASKRPCGSGWPGTADAPLFLPALALGVSRDAVLDITFTEVDTRAPLNDNDALRDYLKQVLSDDAEQILKPLRDPNSAPVFEKSPVPLGTYSDPSYTEAAMAALKLRQAGSGPDDEPAYVGEAGWVYWSWDWIDDVDGWFSS